MSHALEELAAGLTVEEFARRTGRSVADLIAFCTHPAKPPATRRRVFVPPFDHFAALRPVDLASAGGRRAFGQRILTVLEHVRVPMRADEVTRFSGGSLADVEDVLDELSAAREVRRTGDGANALWRLRRR